MSKQIEEDEIERLKKEKYDKLKKNFLKNKLLRKKLEEEELRKKLEEEDLKRKKLEEEELLRKKLEEELLKKNIKEKENEIDNLKIAEETNNEDDIINKKIDSLDDWEDLTAKSINLDDEDAAQLIKEFVILDKPEMEEKNE